MFLLVVAAAVANVYTAPTAVRDDLWYRSGDTPQIAYTLSRMTVGSALTVRPDGTVQQCKTSVSSNFPEIDDYTCELLVRRARFAPARAPDGTPMFGVFRTWTQWGRYEGVAHNLELELNRLPAGIESGVRIDVMFLVSAGGRVSFCTDADNNDHATLVEIACQQLPKLMVTPAVVSDEGVPVASVQDATVRFVTSRR